jgi:carbamoyltransferase
MTHILGVSFNYHDAAAVLLRDGEVIAASTEERHSRKKHDASFPRRAIDFCLARGRLSASEIDYIAFYENTHKKFDRIAKTSLRQYFRGGREALKDVVKGWSGQAKFDVADQIVGELGGSRDRIRHCDHHQSHTASAYFCSPFEAATIVTLDGVGEWETGTISEGRGNRIRQLGASRYPSSLGLFYSVLTAFLGFEVNEGEYKVMGMAGFGSPRHADILRGWIAVGRDGEVVLDPTVFRFNPHDRLPFTPALLAALGAPRAPESEFDPTADGSREAGTAAYYADIAASVQLVCEEIVERIARRAVEMTGIRALCFAGGVALNSAANRRLRERLGVPMFIQPAAGDAGGALGAAKWHHHIGLGNTIRVPMISPLLGSAFEREQILATIREHYESRDFIEMESDEALCARIAEMLAKEQVIGWFQGCSEWGPRSLGNRSILASPRSKHMQLIVNEKIKFREPFRPFAPAVLAERAGEFFQVTAADGEDPASNPYNFMLATAPVREEARALIPAVTHVDGTARVQTVRESVNPRFYRLIAAFGARTGVPVLLNTSFNLRGEPIVDTPQDAIKTFEFSGMDALVLDRFIVTKGQAR